MADYADKSAEAADTFLMESLSWRRAEVDASGGHCLNCEAEIDLLMRWCDTDCRDDWQKRNPHRDVTPEERRAAIALTPGRGPEEDEDPVAHPTVGADSNWDWKDDGSNAE